MDLFAAAAFRRSVRKYTAEAVPSAVIEKAIDMALLAPNSSNLQTWRMYWVQDQEKKKQLARACLNQGAARTAQELLVFVADPGAWRVAQKAILKSIEGNPRQDLHRYYGKMVPFFYGWSWLAPFKWLAFNGIGIFRPMLRSPWSSAGVEQVCVKSCALACENFMLAVAAQGFDSCPMEGFDEWRVKSLLKLPWRARVVMVISVGKRDPRGIWGERFRLPKEAVFIKI